MCQLLVSNQQAASLNKEKPEVLYIINFSNELVCFGALLEEVRRRSRSSRSTNQESRKTRQLNN
jgi:hypothetical protein